MSFLREIGGGEREKRVRSPPIKQRSIERIEKGADIEKGREKQRNVKHESIGKMQVRKAKDTLEKKEDATTGEEGMPTFFLLTLKKSRIS